jgi:outer membrane immunogenic protein
MVRKALLSSAGLVALSLQGASAQPLQAPVFSWTGAYVGVLAGAGVLSTRWTDVGFPGSTDTWAGGGSRTVSPTGFVFGGFAGFNWQAMPGFVIGVEADFTYNSGSGSAVFVDFGVPRGFTAHANFAGSLRGRAGIAVDRVLFYVTGGLALGNPFARWFDSDPGADWRVSGFRTGYVFGGGAEVMVTANWTVRVEALYFDFGTIAPTQATGQFPAGYVMRTRSSQTQARVGAAYRF